MIDNDDKDYTYTPTGAPVDDPVYQGRVLRELEHTMKAEYLQALKDVGGKATKLDEDRVVLLYELVRRITDDDSSRGQRAEAFDQFCFLDRKELERWIGGFIEKVYPLAGRIYGPDDPWAGYGLEEAYRSLILLLKEHCGLELEMPERYPEPKSESTNREETQ